MKKQKIMRDKALIRQHRGGELSCLDHRNLNSWARECCLKLMELSELPIDDTLIQAFKISELWETDKATVADIRKMSVLCHQLARETTDVLYRNIYRAVGHSLACAHMADHCLGVVYYGVKALQIKGFSKEQTIDWQLKLLHESSPHLLQIVIRNLERKKIIP